METPTQKVEGINLEANDTSGNAFALGVTVIYGVHGKCSITAIENRVISGEAMSFYKLEVQKPPLSRSTRNEPAIWVPVASANAQGLRVPVTAVEVDDILTMLASREYFFPITDNWSVVQPKLETTIRLEGCKGLAKVLSYLFVLKRKQIVPTHEVSRMDELVTKLLLRELSDALGESIRSLEERLNKLLRQKLTPSS